MNKRWQSVRHITYVKFVQGVVIKILSPAPHAPDLGIKLMTGEFATYPAHLFAKFFPLSLKHFLVPRVNKHVCLREPFSRRSGCVLFYEPGKFRLQTRQQKPKHVSLGFDCTR